MNFVAETHVYIMCVIIYTMCYTLQLHMVIFSFDDCHTIKSFIRWQLILVCFLHDKFHHLPLNKLQGFLHDWITCATAYCTSMKNHFYKMKRDIGMADYEKLVKQDFHTPSIEFHTPSLYLYFFL